MSAEIYSFETGRRLDQPDAKQPAEDRAVREAALRNKLNYFEKMANVYRQALAKFALALENSTEGDDAS